MIGWLIDLFTKPQIELSVVDKVTMAGIIIVGIFLITVITLGIWWIVDKIKQRKKENEQRRKRK